MAKKRIGIITYHRSINYGAFLQAFCLAKYVEHIADTRADVEIIDYVSRIAWHNYNNALFHGKHKIDSWKQRIGFERCYFLLPLSKDKLCSDDMEQIENFIKSQQYDVIIVGSDEVWKVDGMRGFPNAYWLNYDLGNCCRLAYAVSSRTAINRIEPKKKDYIVQAVDRFRYIGVRDKMSADLVEQISAYTPELNCDPTFMFPFSYDRKRYKEKICKKYNLSGEQKLLGVMMPDERLVTKIKSRLGSKYKVVSLYDYNQEADVNMVGVNPFDWLKIIGCLDFLVTDRFHGTVFAMKLKIPFLSVETYDEQKNSKLYYLLESNGLDEHYHVFHKGNTVYNEILEKIDKLMTLNDEKKIERALQREKHKSEGFKKELLAVLKNE